MDTDSDLKLFLNDQYLNPTLYNTYQHPRPRPNRVYFVNPHPHQTTFQHVYLDMPFQDVQRRPAFYLAQLKTRARRLGRRLRAGLKLTLTPWEVIVLAVFTCFVCVLMRAFAGEERLVNTCGPHLLDKTDTANETMSHVDGMNSTVTDALKAIILHDHSLSGHRALVEEIVAMDHVLPPTPFVRAV